LHGFLCNSLEHLPVKNRYSVGIYLPKGVGEGERPGLTVGTAGGIGVGCGCREILTVTSIRTALWVKYDYLEGGWVGVKLSSCEYIYRLWV
jgi:hypothetical protein